jgi:hypothetical protein
MPKSTQLRILVSIFTISILLASFAAHLPATQDSAKPTAPISVKQIQDKNLAAVGGLDALRATQTLEVRGVFGAPRSTAPSNDFLFLYKGPGTDLFELESAGLGQTTYGRWNGKQFFKRSEKAVWMFSGVSAGVLEEAWSALLESDSTPYREIKLVGLAEIDKKWTYALRFEPKTGDPTVRYYDSQTFLLTRIETVEKFRTEKDGPMKAYIIDTDFQNYEAADDLHLPHLLISSTTNRDLEFHVHSIKVNVPIDDSKFTNH